MPQQNMLDKRLKYSEQYLNSKKEQRNFYLITMIVMIFILAFLML